MNLLLFVGVFFLATFLLGISLEKIRIPWIFAALLLGLLFSFWNPWPVITSSPEINFLSQLGLYFLLFLIGFEIDLPKIKSLGKFIIRSTFAIELFELIFVGFLIYLIFKLPIWLSMIIALSFATVGEAVLLPILEEFKLVKTKLGQLLLGIASFDDVLEVLALVLIVGLVPILLGQAMSADFLINTSVGLLVTLMLFLIFWYSLSKLEDEIKLLNIPNIATLLPLIFALFFLFLGLGFAFQKELIALTALLSGLVVRHICSRVRIEEVEESLKNLIYGLFAPFFFFSVGLETNLNYLVSHFWLVILFVLTAKLAKIIASYLTTKEILGTHGSIYLGVALGVRFSTSLVLLKILLDSGFIGNKLFSILIGTSIAFKFIVPALLSYLAARWKLSERYTQLF